MKVDGYTHLTVATVLLSKKLSPLGRQGFRATGEMATNAWYIRRSYSFSVACTKGILWGSRGTAWQRAQKHCFFTNSNLVSLENLSCLWASEIAFLLPCKVLQPATFQRQRAYQTPVAKDHAHPLCKPTAGQCPWVLGRGARPFIGCATCLSSGPQRPLLNRTVLYAQRRERSKKITLPFYLRWELVIV